ncbi:MAG: ATP-binding protein [Methanomassiliicoccales archaeon]|jgi:PAS domain S-box-containing protein
MANYSAEHDFLIDAFMSQNVIGGSISLVEQDESKKNIEQEVLPISSSNAHVADSTPVLMCSLDREGHLRYYNRAFEVALECSDCSMLGTKLSDLACGPDALSFSEMIGKCSRDASVVGNMTTRLRAFSGTEVVCKLNISPVVEKEGVVGVSVFGRRMQTENAIMGSMPLSSQLLDELLTFVHLMVMAFDQTGKIIVYNKAVEEVVACSSHEVLGSPIMDILDPKEIVESELMQAIQEVLSGKTRMLEMPLLSSHGTLFMNWRLTPLKDDIGNMTGVLALSNDPTQAVRMKKEIEQLGRHMEILAETTRDISDNLDPTESIDQELIRMVEALDFDFAVFRLIEEGNVPQMFCSGIDFRNGRTLLESPLEDGTPLFHSIDNGNIFTSEDLQKDRRIAVHLEKPRAIICLPVHFRRESYGCAIFGSYHTMPDIMSKETVLQVFCNQVAISHRNGKLHRRLVRSNNEFQILYDASKVLSSTLDHNEVLVAILNKARQLVSAENCILFEMDHNGGKLRCTHNVCQTPMDVVGMEIELGEGISGLVAKTGQGMLLERADLDERSVLIEGTPDEPSSLISVPMKFGDEILGVITLEKRPGLPFTMREYKLVEMFSVLAATAIQNASTFSRVKEKASRQQVYNILLTHDVANYNVPIHGFLEMLLTDPKLDERQRRYVKSALAQSENISSLISDVRKLWKLKATEQSPLLQVDLSPILSEAIHDIQMNALYGDIQISYQTPQGRLMVNADSFLKDVFYNLLSNACKYGDQKPIEVSVAEHSEKGLDFFQIVVADYGHGIPDDRKNFLFRRFDQLDSESAAEGHGLGLSVVNALAERYGGRVWVDNRENGDFTKGSIFSLIIPRVR